MAVPFLDLQAQYRSLKHEIDPAIQAVIDTSAFVLGPAVERFERAFADYCGTAQCAAVSSGTSAVALLLRAHGIGAGDEVITVANTFFATTEAIEHAGATPVLVDCEESTALIDPRLVEAAVTPRTRAILPVHLYGQPADMDALAAIARRHGALLLEDACQAHGARYRGRRTGGLADGAAFSFYPGKNLGAYGEAGAVTTNDAAIACRIRMLRDHGSPAKYQHTSIGWNERMDGIQGAVLETKLRHLDGWNARRRAHAAAYRAQLPDHVQAIASLDATEPVYHLFVVRVANRDRVQQALAERGIGTGIHYPIPIHLQPAYDGRWPHGAFPHSERLAHEVLSLPMFPELTGDQISSVLDALRSAA